MAAQDFSSVRGDNAATFTATRTITSTNNGPGDLTITAFAIGGTNAAVFTFSPTPTVPVTVPNGMTTTVTVVFNPSATGSRAATLDITSDAAGPPTSSGLTGAGTTAVIDVTDRVFGIVLPGDTLTRTLTVSNTR